MWCANVLNQTFGVFVGNNAQHVVGHGVQVPLGIPAPLVAGARVVHLVALGLWVDNWLVVDAEEYACHVVFEFNAIA